MYSATLRGLTTHGPMFFALGDPQGNVPVRTASFDLADRPLIWTQMRLYPDRLILTGWYFWGRYRRSIALNRVAHTEAGDRWVFLRLSKGSKLQLDVPDPQAWARAIRVYRDVRE